MKLASLHYLRSVNLLHLKLFFSAVVFIAVLAIGRITLGPTLGCVFFSLLIATFFSVIGTNSRLSNKTQLASLFAISFAGVILVSDLASVEQRLFTIFIFVLSCILLWQLKMLLGRYVSHCLAEAVVFLLWIAWVAWPIYLADALNNLPKSVNLDLLLRLNPLLVLNGVYPQLCDWSHRPLAYSTLLTLGQDIPYALPQTPWVLILGETVLSVCVAIIAVLIDAGNRSALPFPKDAANQV